MYVRSSSRERECDQDKTKDVWTTASTHRHRSFRKSNFLYIEDLYMSAHILLNLLNKLGKSDKV